MHIATRMDFEDTFAPTAKMINIRLVLALAKKLGWSVHQTDVKSVVSNGYYKEVVHMTQLEEFEEGGKSGRFAS